MAREPQDVFIREFLRHPGWEFIFEKLEVLANDLKEHLYLGSKDQFDQRKGMVDGVLHTVSLLQGLIKSSSER